MQQINVRGFYFLQPANAVWGLGMGEQFGNISPFKESEQIVSVIQIQQLFQKQLGLSRIIRRFISSVDRYRLGLSLDFFADWALADSSIDSSI